MKYSASDKLNISAVLQPGQTGRLTENYRSNLQGNRVSHMRTLKAVYEDADAAASAEIRAGIDGQEVLDLIGVAGPGAVLMLDVSTYDFIEITIINNPTKCTLNLSAFEWLDSSIAATAQVEIIDPLFNGQVLVALSDQGADADTVRIGDGTETLEINGSGAAETNDQQTHARLDTTNAALTTLNTTDFSTSALQNTMIASLTAILNNLQQKANLADEQPISATSLPLPLGASTESTLQNVLTALNALNTELLLKAKLTDTQPVSLASSPLAPNAATESTLQSLLTELEGKADTGEAQLVNLPGVAQESTLAAVNANLVALLARPINLINRPVTLNSQQVVSGVPWTVPANTISVSVNINSNNGASINNQLRRRGVYNYGTRSSNELLTGITVEQNSGTVIVDWETIS